MRILTPESRFSLGGWLFWGLGTYLVLEVVSFLFLGAVLKKTTAELAYPYLAFAMPGIIFMPLVWWLKQRRTQGISLKRLAREWGVSGAIFSVAAAVAVFYTGVRLGLMDLNNAVGGFVLSVLLSVPAFYFTLYYMVITRISSRETGERDDGWRRGS